MVGGGRGDKLKRGTSVRSGHAGRRCGKFKYVHGPSLCPEDAGHYLVQRGASHAGGRSG